MDIIPNCLLCESHQIEKLVAANDKRFFYKCWHCELVWKPASFWLDEAQEKARYLSHNNDVNEPKYRNYLEPMRATVLEHLGLKPRASGAARTATATEKIASSQGPLLRGLDYGCGPTEVFRLILDHPQIDLESFDPHFFKRDLEGPYDFIICQEVCEHFKNPKEDFIKLKNLLSAQGVLFLKTNLYTKDTVFFEWFYANDFTHVCFYNQTTVRYLGGLFHCLVFV
jgi:hypothetical protein